MLNGWFGKKEKTEKVAEAKETETKPKKKKVKKKPAPTARAVVKKTVPKGAERTVVGKSKDEGPNAMEMLRAKQSGEKPQAKAKPTSKPTVKDRGKEKVRKKKKEADSTNRTTIHAAGDGAVSAMEMLRKKKETP